VDENLAPRARARRARHHAGCVAARCAGPAAARVVIASHSQREHARPRLLEHRVIRVAVFRFPFTAAATTTATAIAAAAFYRAVVPGRYWE